MSTTPVMTNGMDAEPVRGSRVVPPGVCDKTSVSLSTRTSIVGVVGGVVVVVGGVVVAPGSSSVVVGPTTVVEVVDVVVVAGGSVVDVVVVSDG